MAAEEASMRGFFGRVITFYERWARRALEHPLWLVGLCAILLVASYFCYRALGSDLLPAMDEGGFVIDYIMPAGSSLQETNRVIDHLETIVRAEPEVASVSQAHRPAIGARCRDGSQHGRHLGEAEDQAEPERL